MKQSTIEHYFEEIGFNGRYQVLIVFLVFISSILSLFTAQTYSLMQEEPYVNYITKDGVHHDGVKLKYEYCNDPNIVSFQIDYTKSHHNWSLDFNIYCDKGEVGFIGTIFLIGSSVGMIITLLLNVIGRKGTWMLGIFIFIPSSALLFTKNTVCLYIGCFGYGISHSIMILIRYIVPTEILSTKGRPYGIGLITTANILSGLIGVAIFNAYSKWQYTDIMIILLSVIILLLLAFLTVENPRYHAARGDYESVVSSLNYIRRFNSHSDKEITEDDIKQFNSQDEESSSDEEPNLDTAGEGIAATECLNTTNDTQSVKSFSELKSQPFWTKRNLKKLGFLSILLICINFAYYLNVSELRDYERNSIYYFFCIPQTLGYPLLGIVSDKYGRKMSIYLTCSMIIAMDAIKIFAPQISGNAAFVIYLIKRLFIFIGQTPCWTISSETMSQENRSKAMFFIGFFALGISSITSYIYEYFKKGLYFIEIGFVVIGVTIAAIFIKETKTKKLN